MTREEIWEARNIIRDAIDGNVPSSSILFLAEEELRSLIAHIDQLEGELAIKKEELLLCREEIQTDHAEMELVEKELNIKYLMGSSWSAQVIAAITKVKAENERLKRRLDDTLSHIMALEAEAKY